MIKIIKSLKKKSSKMTLEELKDALAWRDIQLEKAECLLERYQSLFRNCYVQQLKCVKLHENAELPIRAHDDDAGADVKAVERVFFDRFGNKILDESNIHEAVQVQYDLGIGVEVPKGYMLVVACKSSVYKTGMDMANSIGVVDYGYQGSIKATFNINDYSRPYHVGDPVVQLILVPISVCNFYWGEFSEQTERGDGGHGSTGNLFEKNEN